MKLEDIKAMAETDLLIDKSNLTSASIDTPLMVNKYYNVLIEEARIYKILEGKLSQLYKEGQISAGGIKSLVGARNSSTIAAMLTMVDGDLETLKNKITRQGNVAEQSEMVMQTWTEELDKTDNSLIFIERDKALSKEEIYKKIQTLRDACDTGDDLTAKEALRSVVPTFRRPEEVNKNIAS